MEISNMPITNEEMLLSLSDGKGFEIEANKVRYWRNQASKLNSKLRELNDDKRFSVKTKGKKHFVGRTK